MKIDHIVWAVSDLQEGISSFKALTGVQPIIGGRHLQHGTHNAIVNLGSGIYLEIISVDPASDIKAPRWMGVDLIKEPKITRWASKSSKIKKDAHLLEAYHDKMGSIVQGERILPDGRCLKWEMTKPLSSPEVELVPFLLDWSQSDHHPCDHLTQECELISLRLYHPDPLGSLQSVLSEFGCTAEMSDDISIELRLNTPKGVKKIS